MFSLYCCPRNDDESAMKTTLLPNLIGVLLLMACASTVTAQSTLSPLQSAAEGALVNGEPAKAAALSQDILATDPQDFAALYILALAQSNLDDDAQAATTAARAYRAANDETSKHQAARLVASNRFTLGQYMRTEFWLRRAANHAQNEEEVAAVAREYLATIRANPLSLQFNASIAPSDNVNGGSEDGILNFETIGLSLVLPENRRALSGIAYAGSARLNYRLSESDRQRTSLSGFLSAETFTLSDEAKDLLASSPIESVQNVKGSDFATLLAEVGMTHRRSDISPLGPISLSLNFGTYWEGKERLINYRDTIVQQFIPIDRENAFSFRASARDQRALLPTLNDSKIYDVSGSYIRRLPNRDELQLNVYWRKNDSGPESSYLQYSAGIGYGLNQRIFGTRLSASLSVGTRTYEEFVTTLDGRDDRFYTVQANAVFEEITYFGFSPSMSISGTRTESTAEENTSATAQILFGIESNF